MCDGEIISDKAFECHLVSVGEGFKPLAFEVDYLLLDRIGGSSFAVLCLSKTYGCRYQKYDGTEDTFHRSIPFCVYCKLTELTLHALPMVSKPSVTFSKRVLENHESKQLLNGWPKPDHYREVFSIDRPPLLAVGRRAGSVHARK